MNLLHSQALIGNNQVRNLEPDKALENLVTAKVIVLELFQSPAGQLLVEYLLGLADLYKDNFFDPTKQEKANKDYLMGQLNVLEDILNLPQILKSVKKFEPKQQ